MSDDTTTIKQMIDAVADFEAERDWAQFHTPKNLAMGAAIEAAELMEHFLWTTGPQSQQTTEDPDTKQQISAELADVLTYLLNLAHVMDIDVSDAFFAKMAKNSRKYPAPAYRGRYKLEE